MTPDHMRIIDQWAGVPLTFIFTLLKKAAALFKADPRSKPQRILFIELSEMGSTILADPAIRKARDHFKAEIYFAIFAKNRESLQLLNTVPPENIFTFRDSNLLVLAEDVLKFRSWARSNDIDTVIDLELFSRFTALLTWLSGASNASGFYAFHNEGLYRGDFLTHKVAYNPYMHISKNFMSLVLALIRDNREIPYTKDIIKDSDIVIPRFSSSAELQDEIVGRITVKHPRYDRNLHKLVIINPNSSKLLPQRRWPPGNYVNLINMILAEYEDTLVIITGSPEERKDSELLQGQVNYERCINMTGMFALTELPILYSLSRLIITCDSGPAHFSSITDIAAVILYGPETPVLYGSLGNAAYIYAGLACSPCVSAFNHRKTACRDNVCMQAISPEMVFEKVTSLFQKKTPKDSAEKHL